MKAHFLAFIFLLLSMVLCAQTGLFNLEFEMPKAQAENIMKASGFRVTQQTDSDTYFSHPNMPQISSVALGYYDNRLLEWLITYDKTKKENLYRDVKAELINLHGDYDWGSEESAQLNWDLGWGNILILDWGKSSDMFEVWYTFDDEFYW